MKLINRIKNVFSIFMEPAVVEAPLNALDSEILEELKKSKQNIENEAVSYEKSIGEPSKIVKSKNERSHSSSNQSHTAQVNPINMNSRKANELNFEDYERDDNEK